MIRKIPAILFWLSFWLLNTASAQGSHPFSEDISTIVKYDKIYTPPSNPILFVGSSSIRKWQSLEKAFPEYTVLNRGFGGSVTNDVTYYARDIIFPYKPRQIVIYVGENDLVEKTATADTLFFRFKKLYSTIRTVMPQVPVVYISIKPSPVREQFLEKAKGANALIRNFLSGEANTVFVDVYTLMISKDGHTRPELFVEDMLHMNAAGYKLWEKAVKPYLLKK